MVIKNPSQPKKYRRQKQIFGNFFHCSISMLKGFTSILVIVLLSSSITAVNAQPTLVLVPASEPVILDSRKNPLCFEGSCDLTVNQRVFIESTITSNFASNSFVLILQIKNQDKVTVLLSWIQSKLGKDEINDVTQSWLPDAIGRYTIETYVWRALDNPMVLSPFHSVEVSVLPIQNVSALSNVKCDGKLVPEINSKNATIPILLMQPNSTATVCVTYQILSDWATYPNKDVYPEGIQHFGLGISRYGKDTPPDLFRVKAIPTMVNFSGATNGSNFTIIYKIYAAPNSKGFYDYSVPMGLCSSYALAVGYAATQVKRSDFSPWLYMPTPCFFSLYGADSVRIVSGMISCLFLFNFLSSKCL